MDPFLNMEQHKSQFTQNDLRIYRAIAEKPEQVTYQSTIKLAEALGVSQPALTRFIKVLGYRRYQDFRSDITAWLARRNESADPDRLPYFERFQRLMEEAEQVLTDAYMEELARYVLGFSRIFATGIGKSMQPAHLLQNLLRKNNILVHPCPLDMLNEFADHMETSDLLIVFSVSAQPEIMERAKVTNGKILLVTTNALHPYQKAVDRTVALPYLPPDPEACQVSPILFDIFAELLDSYISKQLLDASDTEGTNHEA